MAYRLRPPDPEQARRLGPVAARALERAHDQAPLQRGGRAAQVEIIVVAGLRACRCGGDAPGSSKIGLVEHLRRRTSPPRARARGAARARCPATRATSSRAIASSETARRGPGSRCEERLHQQRDVAPALAQRRQLDVEHGEPVEEILAQRARPASSGSTGLDGRGDDARPCCGWSRWLPTRSNVPSWSTRRSLVCSAAVEIADLVEEERAARRDLEAALAPRGGAGERALLVAEELALDQRGGAAPRCSRR